MVNICLSNEEKNLLKSLIGKELIKYRHDPLEKFDGETVYGRIELFFEEAVILIGYDYAPYSLFGSKDDEHPRFLIKKIAEEEAVSALRDVSQINIQCRKVVSGITLVEDYAELEWDDKKDSTRIDKAIILRFGQDEMAIQGDYMMPLLDIIKNDNVSQSLASPGSEFEKDPEIKFAVKRSFVEL